MTGQESGVSWRASRACAVASVMLASAGLAAYCLAVGLFAHFGGMAVFSAPIAPPADSVPFVLTVMRLATWLPVAGIAVGAIGLWRGHRVVALLGVVISIATLVGLAISDWPLMLTL